MNLSEFKAWFEGFSENLDGIPNTKQWKRIRDKIAQIKDAPPTTYPVFVERYRPYWPYWNGAVGMNTALSSGGVSMKDAEVQRQIDAHGAATVCDSFNSAAAYRALGKAEFHEIDA